MPKVEVREWIEARAEHVYEKLTRMDEFPQIMDNVQSVTIRERGPGFTVSEWVAKLKGSQFRWVERDEFFPQEGIIRFHQLEGDLKVFQGEWQVHADGARTEVVLVTEFEFGLPMMASLLNPVARYALRQNGLSMVRGIQQALTAPQGGS